MVACMPLLEWNGFPIAACWALESSETLKDDDESGCFGDGLDNGMEGENSKHSNIQAHFALHCFM